MKGTRFSRARMVCAMALALSASGGCDKAPVASPSDQTHRRLPEPVIVRCAAGEPKEWLLLDCAGRTSLRVSLKPPRQPIWLSRNFSGGLDLRFEVRDATTNTLIERPGCKYKRRFRPYEQITSAEFVEPLGCLVLDGSHRRILVSAVYRPYPPPAPAPPNVSQLPLGAKSNVVELELELSHTRVRR